MDLKGFYLLFAFCFLTSTCNAHSHDHHSHGDHHHDDDHDHHEHQTYEAPSFKYSREANEKIGKPHETEHDKPKLKPIVNQDMWLYAMGSTLLISAAPVVILFVVPLDNTEQKQPLLKILLAFASGGLLGDAFLHLIPHATMGGEPGHGHSHSHSHDHGEHAHDITIGMGVLAGILAFLVVEKGVRIIKGGHGHSHKPQVNEKEGSKSSKKDKGSDGEGNNEDKKEINKTKTESCDNKEIKVAGYLNLAADFSHNFTDGLAIGASYLAGTSVGLITTITILLHEVPHEIGDFAILVQSGVSKKNAMLLQLTTAVGALAGTALSLCAQDGYGLLAANWILPFTAGGFIYIALVSVIPELLEEEKPSLMQTVLQLSAMVGGVYMMVCIAQFE